MRKHLSALPSLPFRKARCFVLLFVFLLSLSRVLLAAEAIVPGKNASRNTLDSREKWPDLWRQLAKELAATREITDATKPELPNSLKNLIASSQPRAGDILLALIDEPANPFHRRATNAFVQSWDTMAPQQIETYFQSAFRFCTSMRPSYPQGAENSIELDYSTIYGWGGWPNSSETKFGEDDKDFKTTMSRSLDGQPEVELISYWGGRATMGWLPTGKLGVGVHFLTLKLSYEYLFHGQRYHSQVLASLFFEIVAASTDVLRAPPDNLLDSLILSRLKFGETEQTLESPWRRDFIAANTNSQAWEPTSEVEGNGMRHAFHFPAWQLNRPLPVDLCFDVTMKVAGTRESYDAGQILVLRGETSATSFTLSDTFQLLQSRRPLRVGKPLFLRVYFVLRPSLKVALSNRKVTQYYPKVITTGKMRLKITRLTP